MCQKIWDNHVVHAEPGKQSLIYIDLQLVHEVTSPQAFEGLRLAGRKVRRPDLTVATPDHNIPTTDRSLPIADEISRQQVDKLRKTAANSASACMTSTSPARDRAYHRPGIRLHAARHDHRLRR
jgi:homoaconitase/3-isopropylmalate dehydratase large subunit